MEDVPIFPDPPAITVERTLAIIKPDAIAHAEDIIEEIKSKGFTILQVHYFFYHLSLAGNILFCCLYCEAEPFTWSGQTNALCTKCFSMADQVKGLWGEAGWMGRAKGLYDNSH